MEKQNSKTPICMSELVDGWLQSVEPNLARSTYVKYDQLNRNYITPYFQSIPYTELDNNCLNLFCREINQSGTESGHTLSIGNRRTIFMIVNNTLDYAYDSRILNQKYYIRPRLPKNRKVVRVFSREDQKKIEKYILTHRDYCSLAMFLALFAGLRLGEICGLQWKDISFEMGTLYVNKTVQRIRTSADQEGPRTEILVSQPKSGASYRLIPLPTFLLSYIREYPCSSQEAYLLSNQIGVPVEPRTIQYHYKSVLQKIGVPYLNFHCLRHTFATRCVTDGWDMKTLSEILGHFDIKVTMEYYFHSSFEYKKMQMDKMTLLSQN